MWFLFWPSHCPCMTTLYIFNLSNRLSVPFDLWDQRDHTFTHLLYTREVASSDWSNNSDQGTRLGATLGLRTQLSSRDLCLEATSAHLLSLLRNKRCSQVLSSNFVFLCVKGDASKSGSEIDSCARSMEDVNGSKKDLSASAGEAAHV